MLLLCPPLPVVNFWQLGRLDFGAFTTVYCCFGVLMGRRGEGFWGEVDFLVGFIDILIKFTEVSKGKDFLAKFDGS